MRPPTMPAAAPPAAMPGGSAYLPARRGAPPSLVLGAVATGGAGVIALWWTGTASVSGAAQWLTEAGRILGLLAGYAVLVMIVLMARVPALERGVGFDRLARWHGLGGRYVVSLVVAHAVLILWGYAEGAQRSIVAETRTTLTYPGVLLAVVAGLLLVAVGVVSARAARRRLRHETWYALHLATYVAVALSFTHQVRTGAHFAGNRPAQVAWGCLYAAVALLLVRYRVVAPLHQALRHRLRVRAVEPESADVVSVVIEGDRLGQLRAAPGQFFRWRFLAPGLWGSSHPYSLSAPPGGGRLRITVKAVGDHSSALQRVEPGTRVLAHGPYGAFTGARRTHRKVLLIAGGVGVTPLRALFETLPADPGDLTFVYRASTEDDVVLRAELDEIAAARGARVHYLLGTRAELGRDPLEAASLSALVPDLRDHDVYVCGPAGMTAAVTAALRAAGVRRRSVHVESFDLEGV